MRIAVLTRDEFLYKKIAFCLDGCEADMLDSLPTEEEYDAIFLDQDTVDCETDSAVRMSRHESCELPIPFALDAPRRYIGKRAAARLIPARRAVLLDNREIRLTELEYALFDLIVNAGDTPVSREEILRQVWQDEADGGIVNVYIHYLREKLETDGNRVILASRGRGYSLTEKYAKMFREGGLTDADDT